MFIPSPARTLSLLPPIDLPHDSKGSKNKGLGGHYTPSLDALSAHFAFDLRVIGRRTPIGKPLTFSHSSNSVVR